jgi:hypothetical protein
LSLSGQPCRPMHRVDGWPHDQKNGSAAIA